MNLKTFKQSDKKESRRLIGDRVLDVMRSMVGQEYLIDGKTYLLTAMVSALGPGTFDGWVVIDTTFKNAFGKDKYSYYMFFPQEVLIDVINSKLKVKRIKDMGKEKESEKFKGRCPKCKARTIISLDNVEHCSQCNWRQNL